ncbi:putative kinase [Mycolicibacterium sp. BK634]|uniref:phosphatase domain-containing protein n=1 Tax=Mycolicibacterium sp. BK634 TaxID=2587099 RepID=UPI001616346F|nr:AAA family ATPase [Mycolicibacterium sp. BK634]MBB3752438.1 putative kinase [Mycolicibacterium sp. BK634]
MTTLTCMRGISGSGKSTRAREIADSTDAVVVNRDYLRKQLLGEWFTGEKVDEDRVTIAEDAQVRALLKSGVNVVVDATHLQTSFLKKWARLASRLGADFEVVDVEADVEECKRRVYERWSNAMGTDSARFIEANVIDQQAKRFAKRQPVAADPPLTIKPAPEWDGRPLAVLYDLDGTAAIHQGRSPYDYTRVREDAPNNHLCHLLWAIKVAHPDAKFIACSGRDDTCRDDSTWWLDRYDFPLNQLLMRDTEADKDSHGNKLRDVEVKYRLYNENIRDVYDVMAVFDDRLQVAELWHELGLPLYRVGDPNSDF